MKYTVKVLYTYSVGQKKFYETSILLTDADSFDEAYEKAERFVAQNNDEYTNIKGEAVKTEKVELLDCFCAYDEEDGVSEIYSSFTKNNTDLPEKDFCEALTAQCNEEELIDLRHI